MRIIKLSTKDGDMRTLGDVFDFFERKLHGRDPVGKFLCTNGRLAKGSLREGELLVFTYEGHIVFLGRSASERMENLDDERREYPYFFQVDVQSIRRGNQQHLQALESVLKEEMLVERHVNGKSKNIVRSQGWPIVDETGDRRVRLEKLLESFQE